MAEIGTYTVSILLKAQENISNAVRKAVDSLNQLRDESNRLGSSIKEVGKISLGVISGFIGFNIFSQVSSWVRESVNAFSVFEAESLRLASLSREAGQSIEGLAAGLRVVASAAARELAVSGKEAVTALGNLVKAGLSGREAALALKDAIMLAKIENVDFATASANLVQVMAQFGVAGSEAKRVVDALVNASRLGIGSANDFAQGLANVGATARAMGMSLEETTSWLIVLERRFGSAQEAGTHLNRFLLELYEIAGKLGVPIHDLDGSLRSTTKVMLDVVNIVKMGGMSFDELQEKLKGVDIRALKALFTFTQMNESIAELAEEVSRSGSAWETYMRYLETTEGKMARLKAENDRLMRSIGEGASAILTMVAPSFLKAVDAVMSAWRSIMGAITKSDLERYLGYLEFEVRVMGRVSEEKAAQYIKAWVDMGEITVAEGLKIAESIGVYNETIQELIDRAVEMGVSVPEGFQAMASAATISSQQTANSIKMVEEQIKSLQSELKILSSSFDILGKSISLGENLYDVTISIMEALGEDVQLSEEAKASKERLAAAQKVLNYATQAGSLVQQALQLSIMGATDASNMLLNGLTALTSSLEDGIVTHEEFISILRQMGVDAQNVAGSLHNILIQALNATRDAIQGNIETARNFIDVLKVLDGLTVHTYHYHHIITVEGGGKKSESAGQTLYPGGEETRKGVERLWRYLPKAQSGAWFTSEGAYYLHRGEMILPRHVAEWFRNYGPTTVTRNISVSVNVNAGGVADPHELAEILSRQIVRNLRCMGA
ncbi:MAG: phage tail tape measure protein [Nitrososphaerota archaeon]